MWLGRARYERRRDAAPGSRNGFRPRHLQTAEGELRIEIPQVREAAEPFVSRLFPHAYKKRLLRTEPLKTMVIGAFVRGLSMRDVESLCEQAGLGRTSKSTAARICSELHDRFQAFCRRDLFEVKLVALFLDAIYLPVRPSGPKEGVICAWGITENGQRALVSVRLGAREAKDDWVELGRDLTARGLAAPRLVVADGAPGLIVAIEELWPHADRQHRAVHRLRNVQAKLPKAEHERVRLAYWKALKRSDQRQGRQAPPPGPHQRPGARRLRGRRPLPRRRPRRPWSCISATRSDTATDGDRQISSNAHSARSAGAPK
jgi:transposase-like protein